MYIWLNTCHDKHNRMSDYFPRCRRASSAQSSTRGLKVMNDVPVRLLKGFRISRHTVLGGFNNEDDEGSEARR